MSAAKIKQAPASANGADPIDPLAEAIIYEQAIADEAAEIRGESAGLTAELFMRLWPLLKRPIPAGFIETLPSGPGKPYESTGVRSVQVQIDRMNNVLGPLDWNYSDEYEQEGKLAKVTVRVFFGAEEITRTARGGVNQGSTLGNIYKGSFTNAAKLAFARLGPGHEVYLGAADLDPDTDAAAASRQDEVPAPEVSPAGQKLAKEVVDRAWDLGVKQHLRLAASRLVGEDVGECNTKVNAIGALKRMPIDKLEALNERLVKKAAQAEPKAEEAKSDD